MLESIKRTCNKLYYALILFTLARRNKAQWEKCLELQKKRQVVELARAFMKFQHMEKKIKSMKERI